MTSDGSPSDLEAHLGYWLRMVSNAVSHRFAHAVEGEGVSVAEWVVLRLLHDVASLPPSQLAARMGMTKGAITKLADRLVAKHLVTRRPNPDDRRAHALVLEPAGRALVPRLAALADANDALFFGDLAAEERRQLDTLLRKIAGRRGLRDAPTE